MFLWLDGSGLDKGMEPGADSEGSKKRLCVERTDSTLMNIKFSVVYLIV